jgi:hypothetical protein
VGTRRSTCSRRWPWRSWCHGRRFIEALVAGYEVTSRLGGASQVRPNVHSHGTWGTAGAAVAVARLRDHDASAIRTVINLATSMSPANSWLPCFEGATIRNLYPGRSSGHPRHAPARLRLRRCARLRPLRHDLGER